MAIKIGMSPGIRARYSATRSTLQECPGGGLSKAWGCTTESGDLDSGRPPRHHGRHGIAACTLSRAEPATLAESPADAGLRRAEMEVGRQICEKGCSPSIGGVARAYCWSLQRATCGERSRIRGRRLEAIAPRRAM